MEKRDTVTCSSRAADLTASPSTGKDGRQGGCIDVATRIFVVNVPTWQSEVCLLRSVAIFQAQLKGALERFGDVEVFTCVNGKCDNGWAFVGYSSQEAISRLKRDYTLAGI